MRIERDSASSENLAVSTNEGELRLLEKIAIGDKQAFQSLYVTYHRRLARFLTRITRRYDVAEEIINDTLYVVWCKAAQFRGEARVSTWIMGIAYRRALKTLKRLDANPCGGAVEISEDQAFVASAEENLELSQWIERALERLPVEQRLAVELTYYLGHSCEEIAQILECPVNTVKTRMFHARRKLRSLLPRFASPFDGERS